MEISTTLADSHRSFVPRSYIRPRSSREEVVGKESGDQWDVVERFIGVVQEKITNPIMSDEAFFHEGKRLSDIVLHIGLDFTNEDEEGFDWSQKRVALPTIKNLYLFVYYKFIKEKNERTRLFLGSFIEGMKEYMEELAEIEGENTGGTTPG